MKKIKIVTALLVLALWIIAVAVVNLGQIHGAGAVVIFTLALLVTLGIMEMLP